MATIQITEEEIKLSDLAYRMFATYAAIAGDAPLDDLPPLRRLQIEHHRWQANKLSASADRSLAVMTLGIVEEACWEMPVAVETDSMDEVFDTLGDIMIYTYAVCTDLRLDFQTLAYDFNPDRLEQPQGMAGLMNLFKGLGMLAHVIGKHRQGTRGYDDINKVRLHAGAAISRILSAVHWLCFSNDWEASVLVQEVASKVMKRDWIQSPISGEISNATEASSER